MINFCRLGNTSIKIVLYFYFFNLQYQFLQLSVLSRDQQLFPPVFLPSLPFSATELFPSPPSILLQNRDSRIYGWCRAPLSSPPLNKTDSIQFLQSQANKSASIKIRQNSFNTTYLPGRFNKTWDLFHCGSHEQTLNQEFCNMQYNSS